MFILLLIASVFATPYPLQEMVAPFPLTTKIKTTDPRSSIQGLPVLRVQINWNANESFEVGQLWAENSGTPALMQSMKRADPYGSYRAELQIGAQVYHGAVGTGKEYRKLVRAMSFRFPLPDQDAVFKLWAENPTSGIMELVLTKTISPDDVRALPPQSLEIRPLRAATVQPSLVYTIYAEGYLAGRKEAFFAKAQEAVRTLAQYLPGHERFNFQAVFAASNTRLGRAQDLGATPQRRDSFLGLYFPHWNKFGRWYNVVYPTDENQLRSGLGQVAYDHPLVLVDDSAYWGVGNYKQITAIPAGSSSFGYLLMHEYGHYLGLNEEYEEDGSTELEFAPGIEEPWSPNITFHPRSGELKWERFVPAGTPLPTPRNFGNRNLIGAYLGGYAGSPPLDRSNKPSINCTMETTANFCAVCVDSIKKQLAKDAGE